MYINVYMCIHLIYSNVNFKMHMYIARKQDSISDFLQLSNMLFWFTLTRRGIIPKLQK